MRILAIGDIHGSTIAFDTLLAAVQIQPDDQIITLGYDVDQGWLTCLDVISGKVWQANQLGQQREALIEQFIKS
jgi:hypothetical protein